MLKKIRIVLAAVMLICITLLFSGIAGHWLGWAADAQFMPSVTRIVAEATIANIAVLGLIILLTLILGRVYCSVICPLGIFQDIIIKLRSITGGKKAARRFHYLKEHKAVRYTVAVLFWITVFVNLQLAVTLLDPYSAYGRMVAAIFGLTKGNAAGPLLIVAGATLVIIVACAWLCGREYCNTICPVGTTLSLLSRFSLLKPRINPDACKHCHGCEKQCKASCIDSANFKIDYSRCVSCMDCIADCKFGAIKYTAKAPKREATEACDSAKKDVNGSRRKFLATTAVLAGTAGLAEAQNMKVDGGLAPVTAKTEPERSCIIVPPGAGNLKKFQDLCTGCQLCIDSCPNKVLRPSVKLENLLQPYMGYERGYCRPECTVCSDVCPTGALIHVTPEEKTAIRIGTAQVNLDTCISCGNCTRHCPTGAVQMVNDAKSGKWIPVVAEEQCIGCGACEYLCPIRPISSITVNGLSTHIIK